MNARVGAVATTGAFGPGAQLKVPFAHALVAMLAGPYAALMRYRRLFGGKPISWNALCLRVQTAVQEAKHMGEATNLV